MQKLGNHHERQPVVWGDSEDRAIDLAIAREQICLDSAADPSHELAATSRLRSLLAREEMRMENKLRQEVLLHKNFHHDEDLKICARESTAKQDEEQRKTGHPYQYTPEQAKVKKNE